jgi:hypothetical protein
VLALAGNQLTGAIPPELRGLTGLLKLNLKLGNNSLVGVHAERDELVCGKMKWDDFEEPNILQKVRPLSSPNRIARNSAITTQNQKLLPTEIASH